jgi:hypothetical protein
MHGTPRPTELLLRLPRLANCGRRDEHAAARTNDSRSVHRGLVQSRRSRRGHVRHDELRRERILLLDGRCQRPLHAVLRGKGLVPNRDLRESVIGASEARPPSYSPP